MTKIKTTALDKERKYIGKKSEIYYSSTFKVPINYGLSIKDQIYVNYFNKKNFDNS